MTRGARALYHPGAQLPLVHISQRCIASVQSASPQIYNGVSDQKMLGMVPQLVVDGPVKDRCKCEP